jgi:hypothetical protein
LISTTPPARACNACSSLGLNSCWPYSRLSVECLFPSPSTFLCVAGSCTVVDKNAHTIGARQKGNSDGIGCKVIYEEGFQIYEEMRKYLTIYEEAVSHIDFATDPFWISLYMRKILFSFLSVQYCAHHSQIRPYETRVS